MIQTDEPGAYWYLEGFVDSRREMWRTMIRELPLVVGRGEGVDLLLLSNRVSQRHAELFERERRLWLRDLDSKNGTFVNFVRVDRECALDEGDTLQFGDVQMRIGAHRPIDGLDSASTASLRGVDLADFMLSRSQGLERLLEDAALEPRVQPIVDLDSGSVVGHELLSRGTLEGFESSPVELFSIAEYMGREVELSELCRAVGAEQVVHQPSIVRLFVNTHPSELQAPARLVASLAGLRDRFPRIELVVEVHEAAVTAPARMQELRNVLAEIGVGVAFDDFGVGQSRLMELAEAPPDYLKFDMSFVRGLDGRSPRHRSVVARLVETASGFGSVPVAEGIETESERAACRDLGFACGQGFLLGVPTPVG